MNNYYDVIIVGLGPAGSTACYYLAKSGLRVLGIDKSKFPRMKPCGGGITAKGLKATDINWSSCVEHRTYRVKLVCQDQPAMTFSSPTPLVYMVSRPTFDSYLVESAKKEGAEIRFNEKVKTVSQDSNKVTVVTDKGTNIADYLIGADGAIGIVRKKIFHPNGKIAFYVAAETESCPSSDKEYVKNDGITFHLGSIPSGYGWIFDKNTHQSVGVYGSVEKLKMPVHWYHRYVKEFALQVTGNHVPIHVHPVPVYTGTDTTIAKDRVLLVGDAAGLVDPLLGEGIYYALYSGRCAGESIAQCLQTGKKVAGVYQKRIDKEICRDLAIAEKLAGLIYRFPSLSFRLFREYPVIFQQFCRVLSGEITYREFILRLKSELLIQKPILTRFLLGTNRIRILLSTE